WLRFSHGGAQPPLNPYFVRPTTLRAMGADRCRLLSGRRGCPCFLDGSLPTRGCGDNMLRKRVGYRLGPAAGMIASVAADAWGGGPYAPRSGPDLYVTSAPPPFTWRGFYLGGNLGGAWATSTLSDQLSKVSFDRDNNGFIGGVQVGYNFQVGNLVLGLEWDF